MPRPQYYHNKPKPNKEIRKINGAREAKNISEKFLRMRMALQMMPLEKLEKLYINPNRNFIRYEENRKYVS